MPVTVCWAAKGGSGTTLVAAAMALTHRTHSLLVDLDGQLPLLLGTSVDTPQGVSDWLASDAPTTALDHLAVDVDRTTRLLPAGSMPGEVGPDRWSQLVDWLDHGDGWSDRGGAIVDAGTGAPPPALIAHDRVRSLLVTRNCYVGIHRAMATGCRPDGIVLVAEPGRALRVADVERGIGAPVLATVHVDVAIARAIDGGLAVNRLPRLLARDLRGATSDGRDERTVVHRPVPRRRRPEADDSVRSHLEGMRR